MTANYGCGDTSAARPDHVTLAGYQRVIGMAIHPKADYTTIWTANTARLVKSVS